MSSTGVKQSPATPDVELVGQPVLNEQDLAALQVRQAELLRLLWDRRRIIFRAGVVSALASFLIAFFVIPKSYTSTAQLMPPDAQSSTGMAMMAAMAAKAGGGLAGMAGDLLGLKSSGALFIGVLRSQTAQDELIDRFHLQKVYGKKLIVDARKKLDANTMVSEDRKSGIISIAVTDHDPKRAADLANAYVDELNALVAQLSTSAAHRERVFLEDRLKVAKLDLDEAANSLAQFSSRNNTLDIQTEGKAMLDAASTLAGQLVAAQAELEGLRQIYTDNNARVKALSARVGELRKQLEKLGGVPSGTGSITAASASNSAAVPAADPTSSSQAPDITSGRIGSLPFPTIRNLPLLGAKYADYYRRAKIQETVFELLTEQYELAKVEEAKETPSVKVLDPGQVPEQKSFPPRLLIISLGTFLGVACTLVWVVGSQSWEQTASTDPRKMLAQEIAASVKARLPWSANGSAGANTSGALHDVAAENGNASGNGGAAANGNDTHGENGGAGLRAIWTRLRRGNGSDTSK